MTRNRSIAGANRSSASGRISTSSSISHTHSAPSSSAVRVPSQNPPDPPVLVSRRRSTRTPSGNQPAASATTSGVSSVLALSTTTMRHGGTVSAVALRSRSARYVDLL